MLKNKPTVSIGICAYNEEANIAGVVRGVLSQKETFWKLNKIFVACGGCTDKTVEIVKSIKNKKIVLIINPKRESKAADEQKIFNKFTDDLLVMFDADIRFSNNNVVDNLVKTYRSKTNIQLVGGNARPLKPNNFVEKAVYTTFIGLDTSRNSIKGGNNIYSASGQCLLITKSLVKKIRFPKNTVAEDDFIFFTNKTHGGLFKYCRKAVVYYKLPSNFKDYFRQVLRSDTASSIAHTEKYFGKIVAEEYHRSLSLYLKIILKALRWNPVGTVCIIFIKVFSWVIIPFTTSHYSMDWFTAESTK